MLIPADNPDFKPEDNTAIENLVRERWSKACNDERLALIDLMIAFESDVWSQYIWQAERKEIDGANLLLKNREAIMDSFCNGIANNDGTTEPNHDADYYRQQSESLKRYVKKFVLQDQTTPDQISYSRRVI